MPVGKDTIQKRVAKTAPKTEAPAEETTVIATELEAPKPAPKKRAPAKKASTGAENSAETAPKAPRKKSAPKAPAAKPAETPVEVAEVVPPVEPATAVMANVSPETVKAVVGHEESAPVEHVQIGQKMPRWLL